MHAPGACPAGVWCVNNATFFLFFVQLCCVCLSRVSLCFQEFRGVLSLGTFFLVHIPPISHLAVDLVVGSLILILSLPQLPEGNPICITCGWLYDLVLGNVIQERFARSCWEGSFLLLRMIESYIFLFSLSKVIHSSKKL